MNDAALAVFDAMNAAALAVFDAMNVAALPVEDSAIGRSKFAPAAA